MSAPTNMAAGFAELLKTRFLLITAGSTYNYTYAGLVEVNAAAGMDEGVNIRKGDEEPLYKDSSKTYEYCKTPIEIDVITKNNLKDPDLVVADLLKSIGTDVFFSGTAINTEYINTLSNVPDQEGNLIAHRRIQIEVHYRKNAWSA
jgi:hypothetical protein